MSIMEKISKKLALIIDEEIRKLGHEPSEFYRTNSLTRKMTRIRQAKSFSSNGIGDILDKAEKGYRYDQRSAV